jgi:hypothetical protein
MARTTERVRRPDDAEAGARGGERCGEREVRWRARDAESADQETPQWYQDYKTSVEGARVAAQKYQQGLIDQSNNIATQVGQTVLGSMEDQQAAESRKALANAGTNLIAGMGAANDTYFGDRKGVADASKIATMTNLLTQKRQVQGEKGDYRTSTLNDLRATRRTRISPGRRSARTWRTIRRITLLTWRRSGRTRRTPGRSAQRTAGRRRLQRQDSGFAGRTSRSAGRT